MTSRGSNPENGKKVRKASEKSLPSSQEWRPRSSSAYGRVHLQTALEGNSVKPAAPKRQVSKDRLATRPMRSSRSISPTHQRNLQKTTPTGRPMSATNRQTTYIQSESRDTPRRSLSPTTRRARSIQVRNITSPGSPSSFASRGTVYSAEGGFKIDNRLTQQSRNSFLLGKFSEYRIQGKLIDLTLKFQGGEEIRCHRLVLAAASPYFKAMLSGRRGLMSRYEVMQMRGVQYTIMDLLVDYAYSGIIVGVERDYVRRLSESSQVFQFKDVYEASSNYLAQEKKVLQTMKTRAVAAIEKAEEEAKRKGRAQEKSQHHEDVLSKISRKVEDSGRYLSSELGAEKQLLGERTRNDSGNDSRQSGAPSYQSHASEVGPDFSYRNLKHANAIMREMARLRKEDILFDVVLRTQFQDFPCHRLILESGSTYLSELISTELDQSRHMDVFLTRILPDTLEKLIGYLYTGKMEITDRDVRSIHRWACRFQLESVCDACHTLDRSLDSANVAKSVVSEKTALTNP